MADLAEAARGRAGRLAYREWTPVSEPAGEPVLLVHGFPESAAMWEHLAAAIAAAGRRAIAPDLLGYGDSEPDPPATWERHVEALAELVEAHGLERVVLVVHDWGGLIGLRWACERAEHVAGLVISNSGFFPDGEWHGLAKTLRTPGEGEKVLEGIDRKGFGALMAQSSRGFGDEAIDRYFKAFETPERRAGVLEMYGSGDFEKLAAYEGCLGKLDVPTLILWGEDDESAPVAGAYRFRKEIPHAELEVIEGAGHFVFADEPERCAERVVAFLSDR